MILISGNGEISSRLHAFSLFFPGSCPNNRDRRIHIVMDADEQLRQPIVSNGLPLTKIHHAAFDAHLIGIDPDYRIHVSERLLDRDGPFLELGLKGIADH